MSLVDLVAGILAAQVALAQDAPPPTPLPLVVPATRDDLAGLVEDIAAVTPVAAITPAPQATRNQ